MESLNRVELVGTVGRVTINAVGDTKAARLSMATEYGYRAKDGGWIRETTWFNVTAFQEKSATPLEGIAKGSIVRVKGRLRNIRFTDAVTGAERNITEVYASGLELLSDTGAMSPENAEQ